jgi:hypothetical protein
MAVIGPYTRKRGFGFSGLDSTRPSQKPEPNRANDTTGQGGSAPGGLSTFPIEEYVSLKETPTSRPNANDEPAAIPDHQIPIYDENGFMRGRVHRHATSSVVARFTGRHGAQLQKRAGRFEWHMPPRKSGAVTAQAQGALNDEVHAASLRAAKGSVTKNPTAPRTHARPHR